MPEYPGESAGEDELGLVFGPVEKRRRPGLPRRTVIGFAVFFAVAVVAAAVVTFMIVDRPPKQARVGLGFDAFSQRGLAVPGGVDAAFSPGGTRLAALRGGGSLGLVESGQFRPIVPIETVVVGFTWLDDSRIVIREGPASTGTVVAIGLDATVKGVTPLTPDVPPGQGMAATPDRRTLALVSSGLETSIGGPATTDLFLATLPEGTTRQLTSTPDVEELTPVFVSDTVLAYAVRDGDRTRVETVDIVSGDVSPMLFVGEQAEVIGVVDGRVVWTDGNEVFAAGRTRETKAETLARLKPGESAVAIDPRGERLVLRVSESGDSVLRLVNL